MNNEGESVIEEYLILVREKLPEAIADDVISELRSYMHESAREKGDGEITVQSAKKVVAQFGAPGEVADEYRYSMLPETIPEETIPKDTMQEMQHVIQQEPIKETKPVLTPIPQEDPSVSYRSFFLTTSFQSIIWITIISLLTLIVGPIGFPGWTLLIPISQVGLVISALFLQSVILRWNKTILWRRAYREWSAFQNYVTLPENSVPEMGRNIMKLDALASLLGIILFTSALLLSAIIVFLFWGIPICLLLGARIYYRAVTFREDKDPIRNSRKQFVINVALLVVLNASLFWIFNWWGYWSNALWSWGLLLLPFIVGYGSVLLMNIVTGAQNLWWKTQDEPKETLTKMQKVPAENKARLLAGLRENMGGLYARAAVWILVYNLPQIYISFDMPPVGYWYSHSEVLNWIILLPLEATIAGVMLVSYFAYRRFLIKKLDSSTIFGSRTRMEAFVDSLVSSFFFVIIIPLIFANILNNNIENEILFNQRNLGVRWGIILTVMQIIGLPLAAIGLFVRIIGDIHDFRPKWKKRAVGLIEQSGVLLVLAIAVFSGSEFLQYLSIYHWYSNFMMGYLIFLPLVLVLSFQIGISSLKGKILNGNCESPGGKLVKSNNMYSSIAN
jgi:hypothetical protein